MTHQIIRTPEALEALDPETLLICIPHDIKGSAKYFAFSCRSALDAYLLPAVVIATGEQVRAARKALGDAA